MRILFCGDVMGRSGRDVLIREIPKLRETLALDIVIANVENAAAGYGVTKGICDDLTKAGVDAMTMGNHTWDQQEIISWLQQTPHVIRPINYPAITPGRGATVLTLPDQRKILIINVMGQIAMEPIDHPFYAVEEALKSYTLGHNVHAILIDVHAEATSEKQAMAYYLDGRVSVVVGTHTHVPTVDARRLPKGTALQTDVGMCGDYQSVIGMDAEGIVSKFLKRHIKQRMQPAAKEGTLCGLFVETDDTTGLCTRVHPVIVGPHLPNLMPTDV